jgi:hypothetical protein
MAAKSLIRKRLQGGLMILAGIGATVGIVSLAKPSRTPSPQARGLVYSAEGFGGWTGKQTSSPAPTDALDSMRQAYRKGQWKQVVTLAQPLVTDAYRSSGETALRTSVLARRMEAYALAFQSQHREARERFTYMEQEAERLPEGGTLTEILGHPEPTLADEGAFQRIVCLGAMGDKAGAETEYKQFLKARPLSLLVHAAVKRVRRFHEGNAPQEVETLWRKAMAEQKRRDKEIARSQSLCAPRCLAELLRRKGQSLTVETLAKELKTDENGTSVAALVSALKRRGFAAQGVKMTAQGLAQQARPFVALIAPGHFVIVEQAQGETVRFWNPKSGTGTVQTVSAEEWRRAWDGIAVTL